VAITDYTAAMAARKNEPGRCFRTRPIRFVRITTAKFAVPTVTSCARDVALAIAGAFPIEDARGEDMNRAETVTLFNEMCVLAPGYPHRSRHCVGGRRREVSW
jgi:hypothetical protein